MPVDELQRQEIIKVRELIPHVGLLTKIIPLKLLLDIVPSSSADIARVLLGFLRGGSAYVASLVTFCTRLFRQRLSQTSVKANSTMPISIMGSDSWCSLTEVNGFKKVFVLFPSIMMQCLYI